MWEKRIKPLFHFCKSQRLIDVGLHHPVLAIRDDLGDEKGAGLATETGRGLSASPVGRQCWARATRG
jgi:hypothetical protein